MRYNFLSRRALLAGAVIALAALPGASKAQAPGTPTAFLKWSMGRYKALTSFQAECQWSVAYGGPPSGPGRVRTIQYAAPNRYKIVSDNKAGDNKAGDFVQTSVSNGKQTVEYSSIADLGAQTYPAPTSLAAAKTMQMMHPMFCGTLLYQFFGGPDNYAALVDAGKGLVRFGPDIALDGVRCKMLRFYAAGPYYGHTEAAIGVRDGLVRRIRYDSEPLMKMMQSGEMKQLMQQAMNDPKVKEKLKGQDPTKLKMPATSQTTELYTHLLVNKPIPASAFDTKLPEGVQATQMPGGSDEQKPPVALGQMAPDFEITSLDGKTAKLSDFRGKVVLLDFWATWCPPCRKSLPETQKLHQQYGEKGLAVLAISDEDSRTVTPFLKENRYTFPTYLDAKSVAGTAYNVSAIPTVAVIDRGGHLASYFVGLQEPETILAALQKAGLETK
jgi:peroxiredoxin